jgi:hypothetical protein
MERIRLARRTSSLSKIESKKRLICTALNATV